MVVIFYNLLAAHEIAQGEDELVDNSANLVFTKDIFSLAAIS